MGAPSFGSSLLVYTLTIIVAIYVILAAPWLIFLAYCVFGRNIFHPVLAHLPRIIRWGVCFFGAFVFLGWFTLNLMSFWWSSDRVMLLFLMVLGSPLLLIPQLLTGIWFARGCRLF
jgi:hypothetical protein